MVFVFYDFYELDIDKMNSEEVFVKKFNFFILINFS